MDAGPHTRTQTRARSRSGAARAARPRGPARRDAILDATLQIVGEHGADAVTHRRVAERAGLPLASTTYWFTSKEHLLTAALERAVERNLARLRAAVAADGLSERAVTPAEIVAVLVFTEESPAGRGSLLASYTLLLEAARRPALRALSDEWTEVYLATFGDLLARAGSRDPAADARLLVAAADGLVLDALASGVEDADRHQRELTRLAEALVGSR